MTLLKIIHIISIGSCGSITSSIGSGVVGLRGEDLRRYVDVSLRNTKFFRRRGGESARSGLWTRAIISVKSSSRETAMMGSARKVILGARWLMMLVEIALQIALSYRGGQV